MGSAWLIFWHGCRYLLNYLTNYFQINEISKADSGQLSLKRNIDTITCSYLNICSRRHRGQTYLDWYQSFERSSISNCSNSLRTTTLMPVNILYTIYTFVWIFYLYNNIILLVCHNATVPGYFDSSYILVSSYDYLSHIKIKCCDRT